MFCFFREVTVTLASWLLLCFGFFFVCLFVCFFGGTFDEITSIITQNKMADEINTILIMVVG